MARAETCYFSFSHGLRGCYMPDAHYGPYSVRTRAALAAAIRDALEMCDAPKSAFRTVGIRRLWAHAKRCGTSSIHFSIDTTPGCCLSFHGMTEEEYIADEAAQ